MHFTKETALRMSSRLLKKRKTKVKNTENIYFTATMVICSIALIADFYIVNQFLIIASNIK